MTVAKGVRRIAVLAALVFAAPAIAQEVSESHLKAAHAAVTAIKATDQFDEILAQAAQALKAELIQKNPDMQNVISSVVDETTLAMAPRRADLEKEVALAYAAAFTEEDLNGIATFYTSATGQNLLANGPMVSARVIESAQIWQRGVARDLAQSVAEKLSALVAANNPAPEEGAAPAPDGAAPAEGEPDPAQ